MIGFFIACFSGLFMAVQGVFNTQVTKVAGVWVANGWAQFSALITCILAWVITGRESIAQLAKVEPKYALLGGVIGAGITWSVIKSIQQLGPAKATLFIIVSQILMAYLIELFGLFGVDKQIFEWKKMIGIGIAVIGVVIFQWER